MHDPSPASLMSPAGRQAFDRRMTQLLQAYAFAAARTEVVQTLHTLSHPIVAPCLALEGATVTLAGWSQLQDQVLQPDPQRQRRCAAVQLALSEYTDRMEPDGSEQPAIEISLLHDDRFPFATASLAEIMTQHPRGSAWPGESFSSIHELLTVHGFDALTGALKQGVDVDQDASPADIARVQAAVHVAGWYLGVRWQETAAAVIHRDGLPRPIPVIVATHGLCPLVYVAHMPPQSAPRRWWQWWRGWPFGMRD